MIKSDTSLVKETLESLEYYCISKESLLSGLVIMYNNLDALNIAEVKGLCGLKSYLVNKMDYEETEAVDEYLSDVGLKNNMDHDAFWWDRKDKESRGIFLIGSILLVNQILSK